METVKTTCSMCSSKCGLDVHLEKGNIIKVSHMHEHLLNRRCAKSEGMTELLYSKERLTDPLKKNGTDWEKISWDEAFGLIADKLNGIRQEHGARSLLVFMGYPWNSSHSPFVMERFTQLYGSPNFTTDGSVCFLARAMAHILTAGDIISMDYAGESKCKIIWGKNPEETWPPHARATYRMLKKGCKLIVIDPRSTFLARKADFHAQIRPGTDCALALGLSNVIITEELYDKAFVEQWTIGFGKFVDHVKEYSPEKVEGITGIPATTIREMARMYATAKPGCIHTGIALDHSTNGIQTLRAVAILTAITGNLDVPGGNNIPLRPRLANLKREEDVSKDTPVGAEHALFTKLFHQTSYLPAIDNLITGKPYPIKALVVAGGNPIITWPNTNKVIEGFQKVDFKVVIDIFMTDTANMADIVLPGSTFLERADLRHYLQHYGDTSLVLTKKVVEPIGNSMEDWKIFAELGKRMGYGKYFPWKDNDELVEELIKPSGVSLTQLKENPGGVLYRERKFKKYLIHGFNTPSKKVEIYSETMKEFGYDPMPVFYEPMESSVSRPDLAKEYPLMFISFRTNANTHSQYRNLPSQKRRAPEPLVEINPQTAKTYAVEDGDLVKIETQRGSIKVKAHVTEYIIPNLLGISFGWGGDASVNRLTNDVARDPISGYPAFKSMCRMTKLYT